MFAIWDMDIHNGNARVLYSTTPSTPQFGLPDWQAYVYVVEIDSGGQATHHLVTSWQASDHAALALRRGHDEIIFQRRIDPPNEPATLERWPSTRAELLSAVPVPDPAWPDGTRQDCNRSGRRPATAMSSLVAAKRPALMVTGLLRGLNPLRTARSSDRDR